MCLISLATSWRINLVRSSPISTSPPFSVPPPQPPPPSFSVTICMKKGSFLEVPYLGWSLCDNSFFLQKLTTRIKAWRLKSRCLPTMSGECRDSLEDNRRAWEYHRLPRSWRWDAERFDFHFLIHFHFLVSWHFQKGEYDIILLSELWMKHDHGIIKQELVAE